MEKRGLSLAEIQGVPKESLILLTGPPGAGKSTFCHQVVLNGLAMERPVIFVTTEQSPAEVIGLLREKGMMEFAPGALSFVDAFGETVGVITPERPDSTYANCDDLNSISMAIARQQERIGRKEILLAFDSLTSPYLFNKEEVFRFMRLCLLKFAAEGNSVVALVDEGCGKSEDLVAMMSIADGVMKIETAENRQLLNVVKHPKLRPTRIELPIEAERIGLEARIFDLSALSQFVQAMLREDEAWLRKEVGDFVNLFWPNLAHWSGMLWDPKRFPMMIYELNKEDPRYMMREGKASFPWQMRLLLKLAPKDFSKVKEMKKASKLGIPYIKMAHFERSGVVEYLEDLSKTDEHYFRVYESSDCWGFENVGAMMASHLPPLFAGSYKGIESEEREWNAVETKCIGLGDPYCEFKLVPGEIGGLKASLEKDVSVIERIYERLMDRLMGFLLDGKPLVERPKLGSDIYIHAVMHAMGFPHLAGERYQMALRMGGARSGREVGERLVDAGLGEDEAVKRVLDFLEHCKVGKVSMDETIRINENCESSYVFTTKWKEPSCFFTTGFLNGLFSAVKNQHVREIKCIAAGDPYCEWEIV
jgi:KaiC/GvpD/RAD55 family RecA-like ATPase/predicted hydrocarbon binding protein